MSNWHILLTYMSPPEKRLEPLLTTAQIGQRIARSRRTRRLSQGTVCRRTGLDPSYLSRIENGKVQTSVSMALRIANALGMSLDELLGPSPPQAHGKTCPVSRTGDCLLDVQSEARADHQPRRTSLKQAQLDLLRRFTAVLQRSDASLRTALDVLIREMERARAKG